LDVNSLTVVDSTFTSITLNELSVTGTITASNIVGGSPLTLSSDSNVQVNANLIVSSDLQVGDTITVGDGITVTIKEISAGEYHTALVDNEGVLWGTGRTKYLGVNNYFGTYTSFTKIPTYYPVANVACGLNHMMIIDINGTVSGTGWNSSGQLGIGNTIDQNTFTSSSVTASQVACGSYSSMIIGKDGTVSGTGGNFYGQLGIGNTIAQNTFTSASVTASQIACGFVHSMIIGTGQTVYGTGGNFYGGLGIGNTIHQNTFTSASVTASQIACGSVHTMIIGTGQTVYGTGANSVGQLGLTDTANRDAFTSASVTASHIACGLSHTMILGTNGTVSGTGINTDGQLGIGNTIDQNTFTSTNKRNFIKKNVEINKTDIYISEIQIGYFNSKLNLGFPGYYTAIDTDGNMTVTGNISKGPGGTFNIPHPLPSMEDSQRLLHSFIEGPKMDLVYRGLATLTNGFASVDIDEASNMTQGTFQALTRDVQCFTTNETNWEKVKGKIKDNKLSIQSNNPVSNIEVNWLIMGERNDDHIKKSIITDDEGNLIVEPLKGII